LHHAELGFHVGLRPRMAACIGARHDLGRHRIGNHVLDHRSNDDQQCAENVEVIGAREREPPASGTGEDKHAAGRERRADQDVDPPLRTEDRHAVDELPEHHLYGPGEGEPDADPGQLGRRERQPLLDPHIAGDIDQAQRAIGEIDHQERQIGEAKGLDRPHQTGKNRQVSSSESRDAK
jgi:hypothetical protein